MSDYEWIQELKDRLSTEHFVERAEDKLGNRAIIKQIVDAARQQERKRARLELRAEIEAEVRRETEARLTRKIEAKLTSQIRARLNKEMEARFKKKLRREVEADFKAQLRDLVDFGRWFSWKALRFRQP